MLRLAHPPAPLDDGITVAEAARVLGCDATTVRDLVKHGYLDAWRIGKPRHGKQLRGIRISQTSCLDYRERNRVAAVAAGAEPPPTQKRPRRQSAAHREAIASLRALGVRV